MFGAYMTEQAVRTQLERERGLEATSFIIGWCDDPESMQAFDTARAAMSSDSREETIKLIRQLPDTPGSFTCKVACDFG
jgi:hypothetical protein